MNLVNSNNIWKKISDTFQNNIMDTTKTFNEYGDMCRDLGTLNLASYLWEYDPDSNEKRKYAASHPIGYGFIVIDAWGVKVPEYTTIEVLGRQICLSWSESNVCELDTDVYLNCLDFEEGLVYGIGCIHDTTQINGNDQSVIINLVNKYGPLFQEAVPSLKDAKFHRYIIDKGNFSHHCPLNFLKTPT